MAGRSVPVVVVPRWTSYLGAGTFRTAPIPVAAYDVLSLNFMAGHPVGTTPGVTMACKESNDMKVWTPCDGSTPALPTAFTEIQWRFALSMAWVCFEITLIQSGNVVGLTCYAEGHLELRET
jgi:hypothetical protein